MGAFWCRRLELLETLEEYAGHKAGLVLSNDQIRAHLPDAEELIGPDEAALRVRHEELDWLVRDLLFALGVTKYRGDVGPVLELERIYRRSKLKRYIVRLINEEYAKFTWQMVQQPGQPVDTTAILARVSEQFGRVVPVKVV